MCGIAGLFLKNKALEPQLGALTAVMLSELTARGPDSAGFAIYGAGTKGHVKYTLRAEKGAETLALFPKLGLSATERDDHLVVSVPAAHEAEFQAALAKHPEISVVSKGERIELFKGVGLPDDVASRFGLSEMTGSHAIAHTRMATESAVTTAGAHPFSTGLDQCLVHNGSLSNHNAWRRTLRRRGYGFATENDTEVAAVYLTARIDEGYSLGDALRAGLNDLDGFYTFVVGTGSGFAVLRDPIACKPAVMAETDTFVAFGTEYRALAALPGIATARVWEPEPATVYAWERAGDA